jgi:hypothetical protein
LVRHVAARSRFDRNNPQASTAASEQRLVIGLRGVQVANPIAIRMLCRTMIHDNLEKSLAEIEARMKNIRDSL